MRGKTVVGQRFPVSQVEHQAVGKLADLVVQTERILHIGGHEDHRSRVTLNDLCHQRGAGSARQFA
ncbi:hypothetical protein D3C76_966750 [compost metagenome]